MKARAALPATVALAAFAAGSIAHAQSPNGSVEVYTMGPGDDVFSRFGHASLCVRDDETPDGRCYNWGTTDFSTPVPLTWNVLRGRARFWVSVAPLDRMLALYGAGGEDRTVWRQRVALSPARFEALRARLRDDLRPGSREYVYHHFRDNCTTRIRDRLDAVTGGALRPGTDVAYGPTWRAMVLDGLAADPKLLVSGELLLGAPLDRSPTLWDAMFLPSVLRAEVASKLAAPPEVVYRHDRAPGASPAAGRRILVLAGLALGLANALARAALPRAQGAVRLVTGLLLGAAGLVVWGLALASSLPELSHNLVAALLVPTDLALGLLRGRWLRGYARARVAVASLASLACALGLTPQPLHAAAFVAVAAMAPWALEWPAWDADARSPRSPRP